METRMLTFNWHEPYIAMLLKTGHTFDIARPDLGRNGGRHWDVRLRPLPARATMVDWPAAVQRMDEGAYSVILCHNFADMARVANSKTRKILLFHNKLAAELKSGADTVSRADYLDKVAPLAQAADRLVFVSKSKMDDWGFGRGEVIGPGINVLDFGPYIGDIKGVLRVASYFKERGFMLGYETSQQAVEGFENLLLGFNPSIPGVAPAESYEKLLNYYSRYRVFLHTTCHPYEDGHNMALLEAMAAGMPVVALKHPASIIIHGHNGLVGESVESLREHIAVLLGDETLARTLGANARNSVAERFPIEKFTGAWNNVFTAAHET
ncbi:MAG: glycosyltransferase family 4 protein [Nitrospinae bacterium]|nr:glycosyltransferase family 4 protein [Nitrospinota bacterium]